MSKTTTNDEEVILTLRFCNGELFVKSSLRDELRQVLVFSLSRVWSETDCIHYHFIAWLCMHAINRVYSREIFLY